MKRILCCIGIHWSGRTDGGGMGDAVQCDVCKCDYYGPGFVLFDRSKPLTMPPRWWVRVQRWWINQQRDAVQESFAMRSVLNECWIAHHRAEAAAITGDKEEYKRLCVLRDQKKQQWRRMADSYSRYFLGGPL